MRPFLFMPRIKFDRLVISPIYGNCDTGDIVQCSDAFAKHCVNDLRAAKYVETIQVRKRGRPRKKSGAE